MRIHGHKKKHWPADFPEALIYDVFKGDGVPPFPTAPSGADDA
jgi:hypothetical protein